MSSVPTRNSKPEALLQEALKDLGMEFATHVAELPGRPDIVFADELVAVFVNGCYWHRHENCRRTTTPKTNREFWDAKFEANVNRDRRNYERLMEMGWVYIIAWECEVRKSADEVAEAIVAKVIARKDRTKPAP